MDGHYLVASDLEVTEMPLTNFSVVQAHAEPLDRVLVHCYDRGQLVLVFIPREAIDDYFHATGLRPRDRNLLIESNLKSLVPAAQAKYDRGEVSEYVGISGQRFPQMHLFLADLQRAPESLRDGALDIAAHASFQRR